MLLRKTLGKQGKEIVRKDKDHLGHRGEVKEVVKDDG